MGWEALSVNTLNLHEFLSVSDKFCHLVIEKWWHPLFFSGPVVAGLAGRYGCRTVTIVGSVIGALGFFLSFWADSVLFLYCSFGVIGGKHRKLLFNFHLEPSVVIFFQCLLFLPGIGFGFIYLPAIVTVGHYFESKRAFATGIAVCGSGKTRLNFALS